MEDFESQWDFFIGEGFLIGEEAIGKGGDFIMLGRGSIRDGDFQLMEIFESGRFLSFLDGDISLGGGEGGDDAPYHQEQHTDMGDIDANHFDFPFAPHDQFGCEAQGDDGHDESARWQIQWHIHWLDKPSGEILFQACLETEVFLCNGANHDQDNEPQSSVVKNGGGRERPQDGGDALHCLMDCVNLRNAAPMAFSSSAVPVTLTKSDVPDGRGIMVASMALPGVAGLISTTM